MNNMISFLNRRGVAVTASWLVIIVAQVLLCLIILRSPHHFVYDERVYYDTHEIFWRYGISTKFISQIPYGPGPTYIVVHSLAEYLFKLQLPTIRFTNFALLLALDFLCWRTFVVANGQGQKFAPKEAPALVAAAFMALPTVGVSAGMLLTEMPAAIFVGIFLLTLVWGIGSKEIDGRSILAALLAGLAIGAAILGRPNYLLAIPSLVFLLRWRDWRPRRDDVIVVGVIAAGAALLFGPVFLIWGGVMPSRSAWMGNGVAPWHGILSAGYAGIITFLIAPNIYCVLLRRRWYLFGIPAAAAALTLATGGQTVPMASVVKSLGGEEWVSIANAIFPFVMSIAALAFVFCMADHIWRSRHDRFTVFFCCTALLGLLGNMKVTVQFSSRYVFVFLPFLFMGVAKSVRVNWHLPLRLALCGFLSLVSLASYFATQ